MSRLNTPSRLDDVLHEPPGMEKAMDRIAREYFGNADIWRLTGAWRRSTIAEEVTDSA
jgi:hypothetical protein